MIIRHKKVNFNEVRSAMARRVLASPLAGCVGYPDGVNHALVALQNLAAGGVSAGSWTFLNVEFRRAGTNITLSVNADDIGGHWKEEITDEEGNELTQYKLHAEVNWPCHGGCNPSTAMARIELYRQVTMLASELEAEFCDPRVAPEVWRITRTKEKLAEDKAAEAARKAAEAAAALQQRVTEFVADNSFNMRVGSERFVSGVLVVEANIPPGEYQIERHDGKKFTFTANEPGADGKIVRTV